MINDLFAVLIIICAASFLQSISGFGFSLLAMPLLSAVVDIREAVVIAKICGLFANVVHLTKDHRLAEHDIAKRVSLSAILGMPFGVVVLTVFSATQMRVAISAVIIVLVLLMMSNFTLKVETTKTDELLGFISGVLSTSVSTNGPPLVFLLQSKKLDPWRLRATLAYIFTITGSASFAVLMIAGKGSIDAFTYALISIPTMYLATLLGRKTRAVVTEKIYERLMYVLLLATATSMAIAAIF